MRYRSLPQILYLVVLCLSVSISLSDMTAEEVRAFHKAAAEKRQQKQEVKLNEDERIAREQIENREKRNARIESGEDLSPAAIRDKKRVEAQEERKLKREELRMERNENAKSRENSRKFDIYEHEIDYDKDLSKEEINKLKDEVRERERQEKIKERNLKLEEGRKERERNREAQKEGRQSAVAAKKGVIEILVDKNGEPLGKTELDEIRLNARRLVSEQKDKERTKARFDSQRARELKRKGDRDARAGVPRKAGREF